MILTIADPPYPPFVGSGGRKNRASRWYGDGQRSRKDKPADNHPEAHLWDDPATHRALLLRLMDESDGWAIATSPDGLAAYGELPTGSRIMAWVKPNASPGSHRLRSVWEPVILFPPVGRRSNRGGGRYGAGRPDGERTPYRLPWGEAAGVDAVGAGGNDVRPSGRRGPGHLQRQRRRGECRRQLPV